MSSSAHSLIQPVPPVPLLPKVSSWSSQGENAIGLSHGADGETQASTTTSLNECNGLPDTVESTDGMGAICSEHGERSLFHGTYGTRADLSLQSDQAQSIGLPGPSSNITLTRSISRMAAWLGNVAYPWSAPADQDKMSFAFVGTLLRPESTSMLSLTRSSQVGEPFDEFVVPPEYVTERLLNHFFSQLRVLFPVLHRPTFMQEYARLKVCGARNMRKSWLGLLNIVLALATTSIVLDKTPSDSRAAEAQVYYQRAMNFCDRCAISSSSLEIGEFSSSAYFGR